MSVGLRSDEEGILVVRRSLGNEVVATASPSDTLDCLANDAESMVELMASVLGTLINQLPDDERARALAHVRAAHANGLGQWATPPWPPLQ